MIYLFFRSIFDSKKNIKRINNLQLELLIQTNSKKLFLVMTRDSNVFDFIS
jgi:hypothetical protein